MIFPHLTEHSRLSSESKMQLAWEEVAAATKTIITDFIILAIILTLC